MANELSKTQERLVDTATVDGEASSTMGARVYERLRDDIILGAMAPGQRLTLESLCKRYDVGMTPLREALYRLSSSLLVTVEDRRGFRVASISEDHLREVILLREETEILLLRSAFRHGDVAWETRIVAAYHALMRTGEHRPNRGPYTRDWETVHRDFHFALFSAARLPMLADFHKSLWDHVARYRNLAAPEPTPGTAVFDGHQQLMEAVVARDEELACILLRRHISMATSHIVDVLFARVDPLRPVQYPSDRST